MMRLFNFNLSLSFKFYWTLVSLNRQFVTVDLEDENQYMRKIQELKRRSHVFISYSRNDSAIMEEIAKELQSKGFIVQLAKNDLIPGRPYDDEIKRVIYETLNKGYFIPLVSQSFINSRWCQRERGNIIDGI